MFHPALSFAPNPPPAPKPIPPDDDDLARQLAALDKDGNLGREIKDQFFGRSGR